MALVYALVTVLAWGTWLIPSQKVRFSGQQVRVFYVALANLVLASLAAASQGLHNFSAGSFWLPFSGGLIWALGGWGAFGAASRIGVVRAFGVWAPLNIVVSVLFGAVLFREFVAMDARAVLILCVSLALIIGGVLLIIFSKGAGGETQGGREFLIGLGCAIVAGVLWAAYYLPVKISQASTWTAALPLACGMFAGCLVIILLSRQPLRLENPEAYLRALSSGALWTAGNYGMLLLVKALGAGKGFTISQLAVVVNALCGIYVLRDPAPGTRAARLALAGCVLATIGAILMGTLK